jgi:hypothetical protein
MSLGLIFECGPQGADQLVCEYLVQHIRPGVKISSRTLDNKDILLRDAAKVAVQLLKGGCTCVLVIWDLRPAWPDKKDKPCRQAERQMLLSRFTEEGIAARTPVYLICIEQELESWLLASDKAIAAYLSTDAHPYSVRRCKQPDRQQQPKAVMINHFKRARGWGYEGEVHAIRVLKAADVNLGRLRQSTSFGRFETKLLSCPGL